jgi:hypothetical protein
VTILTTFAVYDRPDGNGDSDPKNKASVTVLTLACALFFLSVAEILLAVRRSKFVWREVSPFGYIFVALLVCSAGCGIAALVCRRCFISCMQEFFFEKKNGKKTNCPFFFGRLGL